MEKLRFKEVKSATSLVVQQLRICLPTQGMQFWSLVWEDPMCCGAADPMLHNGWAGGLWLLQPTHPRACALQQEMPPQWVAHTLQ